MDARRKWWLAGLFSLLIPGLGQFYNGQTRKAAVLYLLSLVGVVAVCLLVIQAFSLSVLVVAGALMLLYTLAVAADAGFQAIKHNSNQSASAPGWAMLSLVFLGAALLNSAVSTGIKWSVVQAFNLPSASMEPTVLRGDRILADMRPRARVAHRGALMIFPFPRDDSKLFIKRVVAVAGDKVELRNKAFYLNDVLQQEPYVVHRESRTISPSDMPRDFFGPLIVPEGQCFVLGDNRDQSFDSRFFEGVEQEKLCGRVVGIYWSGDPDQHQVRWARIGRRLD